ncbi:hypothetical protein [Rhodopseudomonas sp. B29]|uniref:hypothetical protein n=1 Tax=Rhodopseudomonas sp. B29 TaxID=95607 RepID=UPI000345795C|nr:hypothetical protein [Rhodopseudomonas sp. B29]
MSQTNLQQRDQPRQVSFNPPRPARYVSLDRSAWGDCLVLEVNEDGARIEPVGAGPMPTQFYLLFTNQPRAVFRRCRVDWTYANEVGVRYVWPKPEKAGTTSPAPSDGAAQDHLHPDPARAALDA